MIFYKPINFTNFDLIKSQLQNYFQRLLVETDDDEYWTEAITKPTLDKICPALGQNLQRLNCQFDVGRACVSVPHKAIKIHTDNSEKYPKHSAINIPIFNTENTSMNWFELLDDREFTIVNDSRYSNGNMRWFPEENTKMLDSLELTTPHLVRIDTPHNVVNNNDHNRVVLTLRFLPFPLHLWESGSSIS